MVLIVGIVFCFVCALLILVVLLQRGRGGGLAGAFGGAGGHSAFGAKTGDVFTWITVGVVVTYLFLAVIGNYVFIPETYTGADAVQPTPTPAATMLDEEVQSTPQYQPIMPETNK